MDFSFIYIVFLNNGKKTKITKDDYNKASSALGEVTLISNSDEIAFITRDITEKELNVLLADVKPLSHIRVLK